MKRMVIPCIILGVAACADAGGILELVPDHVGPYSPGQPVSVDVWLHNEESFGVDLRLVALDVQGLRQRLFAGGDFQTSGGVTVNHVAKLSGGSWQPLDTGTAGPVYALRPCTFNGGTTLYAGGYVDGVSDWEGAVHRLEAGWWTEIGRFGLGRILSLLCANNGAQNQLYAGGYIWQSDTGIYGLAPWNGSEWNSMPGVQGGVRDMAIFDDGTGPTLYAAGNISNTMPAPFITLWKIAKWMGTGWASLGGGMWNGYSSPSGVNALAVFNDGTGLALYAAGDFRDVYLSATNSLLQVNNIAKWDGTAWYPVGGGTTPNTLAPIYDLVVFDDGTGPALYAGGDFNSAGGVAVNNLARWNGASWSDVGGGVTGDADAAVNALTVLDDGSGPALYAGGRFTNAGGVSVSNIARWDGTSWTAVGAGFDDTVRALAVHEANGDPNLVIEGNFQFDFSTLSDGGAQYALFPELPGPLLIYVGDAIVPGSILHMPAGGSLRLGEMNVVMPNAPATYRLDVASPYGPRGGSILSFGFGGPGDPEIVWASETGELTGDPIPFTVQTGPPNNIPAVSEWGMVVIVLLLLVAGTLVLGPALKVQRVSL